MCDAVAFCCLAIGCIPSLRVVCVMQDFVLGGVIFHQVLFASNNVWISRANNILVNV